jgi:YidC/Oxa1 family membrane protein insertase
MIRKFCFLLALFFPLLINAKAIPAADLNDLNSGDSNLVEMLISSTVTLTEQIEENHIFYGLALYYNATNYYIVSGNTLRKISINTADVIELKENEWLAVVGRSNVLLIKAGGLLVHLDNSKLIIDNLQTLRQPNAIVKIVTKPELQLIAPELNQIRYAHLWSPLAWLARVVELCLVEIQSNIVSNWGMVIVVFSILLKILLLPVGVMTVRFQRRVSQVQAQLAPQLAEIKANYDGEEAHNRSMAAHKELGVSPFYTLKPMLGSFIQIPILIVVFNALGEMPQFIGQPFLWIENLAYPDVIGHLPIAIPMFGDTVSLLPFLMTLVTIYSTVIFQNRHAHEVELKRQKRNLYLMAAAFFVFFYPFPAVMVLYWVLANILQTIQQKVIKI